MRLIIIPLVLAAMLAVGPTAVHANSNQAAAEKIAASLGDRFPGYDIAVSYQNGKVRLVGQVGTMDTMQRALDHVKRIPGIKVTEVENGLRVASTTPQPKPVVAQRPVASNVPVNSPARPETAPKAPAPKHSIWSPQPRQQVASAPVPMPTRQEPAVRQVSNREMEAEMMPPAAIQQRAVQHMPQQMPPQMPQNGMYYQNGQPMMAPPMQGMPMQSGPMMAPPQGAAYHPEAYGPQGPMPGQYNQPNLPDYAWPSYACYPNYAEVCYPKQYSPKAWPYIGPFYPYPQAPLGWRKVTLEHHDGWWWLDFDDGTPNGPFSPLFRQPIRYTY